MAHIAQHRKMCINGCKVLNMGEQLLMIKNDQACLGHHKQITTVRSSAGI